MFLFAMFRTMFINGRKDEISFFKQKGADEYILEDTLQTFR